MQSLSHHIQWYALSTPPAVPGSLIGIQVNGVADVEALLGTWTRGEPTFFKEFEPAHGNDATMGMPLQTSSPWS